MTKTTSKEPSALEEVWKWKEIVWENTKMSADKSEYFKNKTDKTIQELGLRSVDSI